MKEVLTTKEALQAMSLFLERHYDRTHSDDIGALLGDLQLVEDGSTVDPAALEEWRECVKEVKDKGHSLM